MQLYAVTGNSQKLDGGAMFGNAPRAMWENWCVPDDVGRIDLACRCLLWVTGEGKKVLFEAGIGSFFPEKLRVRYGVQEARHVLLDNLQKLGFTDADIDFVVLSHLHFDHAGGLLASFQVDKEPSLLFPNAQFLLSDTHWQRATNPHPRDRASFLPELNSLLLQSGRMQLVKKNQQEGILPGVKFHFSDGHTPGLMISEIASPAGPLFFVSDLIPGVPWVHVPITMGYDRFPELVIEEKTWLLKHIWELGGSLFFTHDPKVVAGLLQKDERERYTVASTNLFFAG